MLFLGVTFTTAVMACDDSTTAPDEALNMDETEALYLGVQELASEFQIEGSITGGLDWQLDGRSGTCMIDLILSAEIDAAGTDPTPRATFAGMMCGLEVEFDAIGIGVEG